MAEDLTLENLKKQLGEINSEIFSSLIFVVYEVKSGNKNDLFMLSKLLDEKSLNNMINFYNGSTIKLPTISEYKESTVLALYYFLTDIKNLEFSKATEVIESQGYKVEQEPKVLGKKLEALRKQITVRTNELIEEIKNGK